MTSQFALRGILPHKTFSSTDGAIQFDRGKIQVAAIRSDNNGVRSHLLDTIDTVPQPKLVHGTIDVADDKKIRRCLFLGSSPAAARSI